MANTPAVASMRVIGVSRRKPSSVRPASVAIIDATAQPYMTVRPMTMARVSGSRTRTTIQISPSRHISPMTDAANIGSGTRAPLSGR